MIFMQYYFFLFFKYIILSPGSMIYLNESLNPKDVGFKRNIMEEL